MTMASAQDRWLAFADEMASSIDDQILPGTPGAANAIDLLEKEQHAAQCAVATIRKRMNALRPISRLPPEILALVFRAYALHPKFKAPSTIVSYTINGIFTRRRKLGSGWLDVIQVCHSWRQAALGSPSLWSSQDIPIGWGEHWAHEFATRAGTTPVELVIRRTNRQGDTIPSWVKELVKQHMFHLQRLSVAFSKEDEEWMSELDYDRPLLTYIRMDCAYIFLQPPADKFIYRSGSFKAAMLRDLTLVGLPADLRGSSWPHLRNLALLRSPVNVLRLLEVLATTPLLKHLSIDGLHLAQSTSMESRTSTIPLVELENVRVAGSTAGVLTLWRTITLPSTASAAFEVEEPSEITPSEQAADLNSISIMAHHYLKHLETANHPPAGYAFYLSEDSVSIIAYLDNEYVTVPFEAGPSIFRVSYKQHSTLEDVPPFDIDIPAAIRSIPMHTCRLLNLSASNMSSWTAAVWSDILQETAHIEVLYLFDTYPQAGLGRAALNSFERDDGQTLFPRLHTLNLDSIIFGHNAIDDPDVMPPPLVDMLAWLERRDLCKVQTLKVRGCSIYAEWVAQFEGIGDLAVVWDGDEVHCGTDTSEETDSSEFSL